VPSERHPSPNEINLVVEVSETTLKQDEGKKLLAYQDAGIPEYWIVDVTAKEVRIHRLNQSKTYSEEIHSEDTIALQAFPDVIIDLGNLF
jgi:Uma2 family endonuclease